MTEKISAMPAATTPLAGTETVAGLQGGGNVQITANSIAALAAAPSAANPTATAGPNAVNGVATTFMRSDGAPAIQKASNAQFGLVEGDGTSITIVAGVASTVGTIPAAANPSATAGPAAVNGVATTFMRSDAAPAIQKASNAQFGLVEGDGTSITIVAGVASTVGTIPAAANPSATASNNAVNGVATTFMRSDAAPAVQLASNAQFGLVEGDGTSVTIAAGIASLPTISTGNVLGNNSGGSAKPSAQTFKTIYANLSNAFQSSFFGDGSDGALSASSGTTTLTRNMYYSSITLTGTAKIATAGFKIFCSGTLDISGAGAGAININGQVGSGNNGGNQVGANGSLGIGIGGGGATLGGTGSGSNTSAISTQNFVGGPGGNGGNGGSSGANTGGGQGGITNTRNGDVRYLTNIMMDWVNGTYGLVRGGGESNGGGAGAGDGTNAGGRGGGAGGGAGVLYIAANTINRGGSTAVGAIQVKGGDGIAGANGAAGNAAGGGGGGGGPGGWLYLVYETLTGSTATGALDASGGQGAAGGNGLGTGTGGDSGTGGAGGRIDVYDLGNGTQTITNVTAAAAGNSHSGATGGVAKAGVTQQVNL